MLTAFITFQLFISLSINNPGNLEIVINPDDWTFGSKVTGGKVNRAYSDFATTIQEQFFDKMMELRKKKATADENEQKAITEE